MAEEAGPGIDITWTFDAPRDEVWREWTEPERFADWYGGPQAENPLETVSMDVREGGRWSLVMIFGPREIHWDGEYVEVSEPERLVFTVRDDPAHEVYAHCTVELDDLGDGRTEMRFSQRDEMPAEAQRRAGEGWSGFFRRIDERLATDESQRGSRS
jgi:uncharacterized protein YndB with AHSA1/START domain